MAARTTMKEVQAQLENARTVIDNLRTENASLKDQLKWYEDCAAAEAEQKAAAPAPAKPVSEFKVLLARLKELTAQGKKGRIVGRELIIGGLMTPIDVALSINVAIREAGQLKLPLLSLLVVHRSRRCGMAIKVGRKWEKGAVYIGRPTVLGNPFVLKSELDRGLVIAQYKEWFYRMLAGRPAAFMRALEELEEKARSGTLVLGCFCAPRACHGDVVKEYLDQRISLSR